MKPFSLRSMRTALFALVALGGACLAAAATVSVQPGQDLAAAVKAAAPGDVSGAARSRRRLPRVDSNHQPSGHDMAVA